MSPPPLLLCALASVFAVTSAQQGGNPNARGRDVCFPGEGPLSHHHPSSTFPASIEKFGYQLFSEISRSEGEKSVIMSPYSIWSVLTLAYFGALGNTQREIERALGFANKTHTLSNMNALRFFLESRTDGATLNVVNRGYFSRTLDLNKCLTNELFDLKLVNFRRPDAVKRAINHDVNVTTQGRIPQLIHFLPPSTRFALVNAVFFKGTWETEFSPELTRPQEFLVPPGKSSGIVNMMNRQDFMVAGEARGLDAMMVELPYKNSNTSMFLLLQNDPYSPTTALTSKLNDSTFATAVKSLPAPQFVSLSLPRFKLKTRYEEELKSSLASLGITSLFDVSRADLSGFASDPDLVVDTAIHEATVEVNEEGTVAAAATAFINTRIGPQKSLTLVFNRPFVFVIVQKNTRVPLFIGKVTSARDLE